MAPGQLWLGTQPIRDWRSLADLGIALVLIPANEKFGDPGSASHLAMTWNLAAKFAFPGPREGLIAMATIQDRSMRRIGIALIPSTGGA